MINSCLSIILMFEKDVKKPIKNILFCIVNLSIFYFGFALLMDKIIHQLGDHYNSSVMAYDGGSIIILVISG